MIPLVADRAIASSGGDREGRCSALRRRLILRLAGDRREIIDGEHRIVALGGGGRRSQGVGDHHIVGRRIVVVDVGERKRAGGHARDVAAIAQGRRALVPLVAERAGSGCAYRQARRGSPQHRQGGAGLQGDGRRHVDRQSGCAAGGRVGGRGGPRQRHRVGDDDRVAVRIRSGNAGQGQRGRGGAGDIACVAQKRSAFEPLVAERAGGAGAVGGAHREGWRAATHHRLAQGLGSDGWGNVDCQNRRAASRGGVDCGDGVGDYDRVAARIRGPGAGQAQRGRGGARNVAAVR